MMTTRIHPIDNTGIPLTLGTQMSGPNIDARQRIRRHIPNIQTPLTTKTSGLAVQTPSRSASARPTVKSSVGYPPLRGKHSASKARRPSSGSVRDESQCDNSQDVKFIDVPDTQNHSKAKCIQEKDIQQISAKDILEHSQESRYDQVYQADVHAAQIAYIDNLERFTKLKVLDLSCNFIKHIDNLQNNTDLRELKLYDNDLEIIENLEKLKELQHLQLQHNRIKAIGKGLLNQRRLHILRLDSNCLCRLEVRELASCGQLTSLDISNNKLDSIAAVSCLNNLEELFVVNNRLRTITDMSRCKKLQEVDVSHNKLTDLSGFKGLPSLTCLHAANNQISSLKSLGKLKVLQELNIKCNKLADIKPITDYYPATQILDISENHVETWTQMTALQGLQHLVELYISGNPFSAENGPKPMYHTELHHMLPELEILDGAHMKKPSSRPGTPLMRPMSASAVVTSRQVEMQMKSLDDEMSIYEQNLASKFEWIRTSMAYLPTEAPSRPATATSISTMSSDRPVSRSGQRSRIKLAQEFAAAQEYDAISSKPQEYDVMNFAKPQEYDANSAKSSDEPQYEDCDDLSGSLSELTDTH